jgi:ketosteroid isomerase-like protein
MDIAAFRSRSAALWLAHAAALATASCQVAMPVPETPREQVFAAERSFAKAMADRNLQAFSSHISEEAIFFTGKEPLRGKAAVVGGWSRFFDGATPPFSWAPDQVEVLPSGSLALSTGLVRDPAGKVIARFNSVWRQEAPGTWRVIFDKGSPPAPGEVQ